MRNARIIKESGIAKYIYKKPRQKNKMTDSYFLQQKTHRIVVLKNNKYFYYTTQKEKQVKNTPSERVYKT